VRVPSKIDDNATSILMSIDGNESFSKRFEVVIKESEKYKNELNNLYGTSRNLYMTPQGS
jgi:hypothetical protein